MAGFERSLPGAAGKVETHEVSRLVVVMGKDGFKPDATAYYLFQYVHLGLGKFGVTAAGEQWFSFLLSRPPAEIADGLRA